MTNSNNALVIETIVETFTKMLNSGIDCVILPKDTLMVRQFDNIRHVIYSKKIPVLGMDDAPTDSNIAVISFSAGNEEIGRLIGKKVVEILKGKKPADIPVEGLDKFHIAANLKVAKEIGLIIPVDIVRAANRIIKEK